MNISALTEYYEETMKHFYTKVHSTYFRVMGTALMAVLIALTPSLSAWNSTVHADTSPASGIPATVSANPLPTVQVNGVIWAQTIIGNTVYATGRFTTARPAGVALGGAGSVTRTNILAYNITTGVLNTSFVHTLTGSGTVEGRAITASPDGTRLYVGGKFSTVDGQAHANIAAFNVSTGALLSGFSGTNNTVRAVAATNTKLYVGGSFSTAGGQTHTNLASYTSAGAIVTSWTAKTNAIVEAMTLTTDSSKLIIGGAFNKMNGLTYYGMGALNPTTGVALTWASQSSSYPIQDFDTFSASASITSLTTNGSLIFLTAFNAVDFSAFGALEGTAAISPTDGSIIWINNCHGDSYGAIPLGSVLYSVGHAHDCEPIGGYPQGTSTDLSDLHQYALAQSITPSGVNGPTTNGYASFQGIPKSTLLHWFPTFKTGSFTGINEATWSITGNSQYISIGGEFPSVNGIAQQGLVRYGISSVAPNTAGPVAYSGGVVNIGAVDATGKAIVTIPATSDPDNTSLTYNLYRDGSPTAVGTQTVNSTFWNQPTVVFQDSGLVPGSSHTYTIVVSDPFGNTTTATARTVVGCHAIYGTINALCATQETLGINQSITSNNGVYKLVMQDNGNLVLYKNGSTILWSTATSGGGFARFIIQSDGNMAVIAYSNSTVLWSLGGATTGYALVMQDDGNLVLLDAQAQLVWSTGTAQ